MDSDLMINFTKNYVIKIGGSLLYENNQLRVEKLKEFADMLKEMNNVSAIITGGGNMARTFISAAREFQASESFCDLIGIDVSRLNARLLISALGDIAYPEPIKTIEDARIAHLFNKILVIGGFVPGQSTTSVTFEVAEMLGASDILVLTNVDGVYDKDPRKYPDAEKFDAIPIDRLEEIIMGGEITQAAAGEYRIFDAVSIQLFKRNKINVKMMNGENVEDLKEVLSDSSASKSIGTEILRE
jgi:uridylate kinase